MGRLVFPVAGRHAGIPFVAMKKILAVEGNVGKPRIRQTHPVASDGSLDVSAMLMENDGDEIAALRQILVAGLVDVQVQALGNGSPVYENGEVRTSPI